MTPVVNGLGAATSASSQRPGSAGSARPRTRRSGQREASSNPFAPREGTDAVVHWCTSPYSASAVERARLGGVPRNSQSAVTSGAHATSRAAMRWARKPPPAQMFQKTIRMVGLRL
jgi:hypothetical protein